MFFVAVLFDFVFNFSALFITNFYGQLAVRFLSSLSFQSNYQISYLIGKFFFDEIVLLCYIIIELLLYNILFMYLLIIKRKASTLKVTVELFVHISYPR